MQRSRIRLFIRTASLAVVFVSFIWIMVSLNFEAVLSFLTSLISFASTLIVEDNNEHPFSYKEGKQTTYPSKPISDAFYNQYLIFIWLSVTFGTISFMYSLAVIILRNYMGYYIERPFLVYPLFTFILVCIFGLSYLTYVFVRLNMKVFATGLFSLFLCTVSLLIYFCLTGFPVYTTSR